MVNILTQEPNLVSSVDQDAKYVQAPPIVSNALILYIHQLMESVGRLVHQDPGWLEQNASVLLELSI